MSKFKSIVTVFLLSLSLVFTCVSCSKNNNTEENIENAEKTEENIEPLEIGVFDSDEVTTFDSENYNVKFEYPSTGIVKNQTTDDNHIDDIYFDDNNFIEISATIIPDEYVGLSLKEIVFDNFKYMEEMYTEKGYLKTDSEKLDVPDKVVYYIKFEKENSHLDRYTWKDDKYIYDVLLTYDEENKDIFDKIVNSMEFE